MNEGERLTIGIIGGGAAGLFAALHAVRDGAQVVLWEANAVLGRKLAVTGNGRGNLSHRSVCAERYTCDDSAALHRLLQRFDHEWLRRELFQQGILTWCTDDGWCYPLSLSAAAVAAILSVAVQKKNITIQSQCAIAHLQQEDDGFRIIDQGQRSRQVHRVILATGSKAHPQLGGDDTALSWLGRMGVPILPMRPALAPLIADARPLHKLQGVRLDVAAELFDGDRSLASSLGNIIFTQYGLNGPAAMDLSHRLPIIPSQKLKLKLNFLPGRGEEFRVLYEQKRKEGWPVHALLEAAVPKKLAALLMDQLKLHPDADVASLSEEQGSHLLALMTNFPVTINGVKDFTFAQLAAGGVALSEVDPNTMQSRRINGLYLAGEILDVVGPCGGFNLHFAFASGALAGISAGQV